MSTLRDKYAAVLRHLEYTDTSFFADTLTRDELREIVAALEQQGEERTALLEEFFQNVRAGGPLTRREAIYDELVAAAYTSPQGER